MHSENSVFQEDLERLCSNEAIPWDCLDGKVILVTGATGLIGYTLVSALLNYSRKKRAKLKVVALVRSLEKAKERFFNQMESCGESLELLVGDVCQKIEWPGTVDYVIHMASQTASAKFVENPVETIQTSVLGTQNLLEFARDKRVKGFVYLSSMEVYGAPHDDAPISEDAGTNIDTMKVRSCYPESKRMCEALCTAYCAEFGVPAKVIRLAQTFGPGVLVSDARVFAEFARCAMERKNIVLQTAGTSRRPYLYTMDAVAAILMILIKGECGQAYNAVNPRTYCSICEMAQMVIREFSPKCAVEFLTRMENDTKYMPVHHLNLQSNKLEALGWAPEMDLVQMYARMIRSFKEQK